MFPPMINWRVHEFDCLYPLWERLCNQGTSFPIHISWGRTWRVFHEDFLGNKHYKTNVELSNTFTLVPLKIQKYNYLIIFFLRPKGTSKGRPNARRFCQVVGGLWMLYFINLSPRDILHIACIKKNINVFICINNSLY